MYTDIIGLYLLCGGRLAFVLASFRVIVYRSRYNSGEIAVKCPDDHAACHLMYVGQSVSVEAGERWRVSIIDENRPQTPLS